MKLSEAISLLSDAGVVSAAYDAKELFMHFGGFSPVQLIGADPECGSEELEAAVRRRALREPLQYIVGKVGFYREEYKTDSRALIPRADTELLVDYAVKNLPVGARFADICTGTGCVGISVLCNTAGTSAVLLDISEDALALAGENAELLGVADRVTLMRADATEEAATGELFAVLSNPPYIAPSVYEALEREIFHEPRIAFVGGEDGGEFYRILTPLYKNRIAKEGFIAFEIGYDQAQLLRDIADAEGMTCEILQDLGGNDRVAVMRSAEPSVDNQTKRV